jgi:hypothetical protein
MRHRGLELTVQIERGWVDPMSDGFPDFEAKKCSTKNKEEKVTIVIDRERGIYSQNKFY